MTPPEPELESVAEAVVETRRRPSIVWLIPLVALVVGAFVAWRTFSERGPEIHIQFANAEGLEAGKTKVKFKDVEVGVVEEIRLQPDFSAVVCSVRMSRDAAAFLTEGTRFWVVRPRVAGGQVTGLGTLFSGAYIGVDPVREGQSARNFVGLEVPPIVTTDEPGKHFTLVSHSAGLVDVGTPIFFRRIRVGEVVASELDASGEAVTIQAFVRAPHDERVTSATRFWNASGVRLAVGAEGIEVDVESVVSLLIGGIAFDTPQEEAGELVEEGAVFELYPDRDATEREVYTQRSYYLLHFDQSVRGLKPGAPVEFRGIQIGEVRDVKLEMDPETRQFRIPVLVVIEPQRIGNLGAEDHRGRREALQALVRRGLRAQLQSGNLLTGQLLVQLDMHQDAKPAEIVWSKPYPEFPTVPTPLEEITSSVTRIAKRLEKVPLEQIAASVDEALQAARLTLAQAEETLASANALVGPDSPMTVELRRALIELTDAARSIGLAADQIQREPDSLIFGRPGGQQ
jgi:paraquat-inducible protein B